MLHVLDLVDDIVMTLVTCWVSCGHGQKNVAGNTNHLTSLIE